MEIGIIIALCLFSYFCGSVPFGKIIGKLKIGNLKQADIQKFGSCNIGSTNVLRVLGWQKFLPVVYLDAWKSILAVSMTMTFGSNLQYILHGYWLGTVAIVSTMLGSMYPVWLKFKGGKGVTVLIGGLLALLEWKVWLIVMVFWLTALIIVWYLAKKKIIASATNLIFVGGLPAIGFFWPIPILLYLSAPVMVLIVWGHRENLKRIISGQEKPIFPANKSPEK